MYVIEPADATCLHCFWLQRRGLWWQRLLSMAVSRVAQEVISDQRNIYKLQFSCFLAANENAKHVNDLSCYRSEAPVVHIYGSIKRSLDFRSCSGFAE